MKTIIPRALLMMLLALPLGRSFAADWWSMDDEAFVAEYKKLATGTQQEQSQFAWMLFGRVNQRAPLNGQTFSKWELWPSDPDTFAPDAPAFLASAKIRTRPHLQQSALLGFLHQTHLQMVNPFPPDGGGEEVTRNQLSYGYIKDKGLNTQAGIAKYLGTPNAKVDFPLGTTEIKALWVKASINGAYQVGGYSLTGLHIMAKIAPRPNDPFTDNTPSWFWTTFEFKNNKGLADAQKLITYGNAIPSDQSQKLLKEAGLGSTPFVNYESDGQQIQFSDQKNPTIVLGNTQIEWFLATPQNHDPTTWKSWSSSCHSCHGQASGQINGTGINFFDFTGPVGPLTGANLPSVNYQALDFVWALFRAQ